MQFEGSALATVMREGNVSFLPLVHCVEKPDLHQCLCVWVGLQYSMHTIPCMNARNEHSTAAVTALDLQ